MTLPWSRSSAESWVRNAATTIMSLGSPLPYRVLRSVLLHRVLRSSSAPGELQQVAPAESRTAAASVFERDARTPQSPSGLSGCLDARQFLSQTSPCHAVLGEPFSTLRDEAPAPAPGFCPDIFDAIAAGILIIDGLGTIQSANTAAMNMLGRSGEMLVGTHAVNLLTQESRARVVAELACRGKCSESRIFLGAEYELYALRADGTHFPISVSMAFIPHAAAEAVSRIVCTVNDLSEQKRLESALRTSDRAKDIFLATLSHELRSPLTVILGHIDLLRRPEITGGVRASIDAIERSARAQASLVADILEMSRIITGKFRLDMRRFEFVAAVREVVEALKFVAEARGISFHLGIAPEVGYIYGDHRRLVQVLSNLLNNAVKFTPAGGHVTLTAHRSKDAILISVIDTGRGIEPSALPNVFRRFWQDETQPTIRHGGLGVGLAIVRHIVESHGGEVVAASEGRDKGARFSIRLPQEVDLWTPALIEVDLPVLNHIETGRREELSGVSILVVDDHLDARHLIATIMTRAGAVVHVAGSALEALDLAERLMPQLIICDIGMPDVDGYEFIQRWRQREGSCQARAQAIALTAYVRQEDIERALASGFELHVAKPVDAETLTMAAIRLLTAAPVGVGDVAMSRS